MRAVVGLVSLFLTVAQNTAPGINLPLPSSQSVATQRVQAPSPKPKLARVVSSPQTIQTTLPQTFQPAAPSVDAAWQSLFDTTKFRSYNMDITPTNLALMNRDPKKELKVPCVVTTDYQTPQAQTYNSPNIGCGYKGSVGALRICFDAYGKFSPDDCRKPSYKIDANYFNKNGDERIAGVHRLMFHGAPADWSMIGERLSFSLLHQWGIIAPSATHASLYENGKFLGVFVFVSAIDDIFTQENFPNDFNQGRGGLYKEAWFNPVHMRNVTETYYFGKNEDAFMNQIEAAVMSTPLDQQSATQFFNTYFDVNSIIDVTAANTVLGNTDDWRQRHNLYWYIREDANGKKAVLIPWDYDRLNDAGADQRGALKGRPWWDPSTRTGCNSPLRSAAARGAIKGGSDPMQVAYWTDIFLATPPDVEMPVSCDRITQLMALALGPRIRQRTRDFAATINRAAMQASIQTWTNQFQSALLRDPDGPQLSDMANEQRLMLDHIVNSAQKAVTEANNGDLGVSSAPVTTPSSSSSTTTFVPKAAATGSDFSKYKIGDVISSTFTPVNSPSFSAANVPSFVPKSVSSSSSNVAGFVPKTSVSQQSTTNVAGFVPKAYVPPTPSTTPATFSSSFNSFPQTQFQSSFQTSFSQPSFSQTSFQSFPQQSYSFPSSPSTNFASNQNFWQGR